MKNALNKLKGAYLKAGVALSLGVASTGAFAAAESETMFKPLLDAINVDSVKSGILSAAGVVLGVTIVVMGIRKIKSMIS